MGPESTYGEDIVGTEEELRDKLYTENKAEILQAAADLNLPIDLNLLLADDQHEFTDKNLFLCYLHFTKSGRITLQEFQRLVQEALNSKGNFRSLAAALGVDDLPDEPEVVSALYLPVPGIIEMTDPWLRELANDDTPLSKIIAKLKAEA